ncbi:MAG: hypothetical protein ABIG84_02595 [archaeon]
MINISDCIECIEKLFGGGYTHCLLRTEYMAGFNENDLLKKDAEKGLFAYMGVVGDTTLEYLELLSGVQFVSVPPDSGLSSDKIRNVGAGTSHYFSEPVRIPWRYVKDCEPKIEVDYKNALLMYLGIVDDSTPDVVGKILKDLAEKALV